MRVDPFGKPAVHRSQQFASLLRFALIAPEPRQVARSPQLAPGESRGAFLDEMGYAFLEVLGSERGEHFVVGGHPGFGK